MSNFFIRKKEIKFVKLILISPWLGQIIDFLYLISLPLIIIKIINYPDTINNYDSITYLENFLIKDNIKNITDRNTFYEFIVNSTEKLYDFKVFPMFIPFGSLRIKKFSNNDDCYDFNPVCKDNFSCKII